MVIQRVLTITCSSESTVASGHVGIHQRRRAVLDASFEDCLVERLHRAAEDTLLPRQMQVRQCSHYTGHLSNRPLLLKTHWIVDLVELVDVDLVHRGAVAIRANAVRGRARRKTTFLHTTTTRRTTRRISNTAPQIAPQSRLPIPLEEPREPIHIADVLSHEHKKPMRKKT